MFGDLSLSGEFFLMLAAMDEEIARRVAAGRCPACRGPLHRGDYMRKPRGGWFAAAGEELVRRFGLCCGREGCRKRATPPSLRFLGPRVYLGVVVIVASMVAQALGRRATAIRRATGVAARTARRWLVWWQGPFIRTEVFEAVRARLIGASVAELPASVVGRLGGSFESQLRAMLEWLAPLTTGSVRDGSRFVRGIA
jgi:hypothetical protein